MAIEPVEEVCGGLGGLCHDPARPQERKGSRLPEAVGCGLGALAGLWASEQGDEFISSQPRHAPGTPGGGEKALGSSADQGITRGKAQLFVGDCQADDVDEHQGWWAARLPAGPLRVALPGAEPVFQVRPGSQTGEVVWGFWGGKDASPVGCPTMGRDWMCQRGGWPKGPRNVAEAPQGCSGMWGALGWQGDPPRLGKSGRKWRRRGSNPQPPPCKGGALPIELRPRQLPAAAAWTSAATISV